MKDRHFITSCVASITMALMIVLLGPAQHGLAQTGGQPVPSAEDIPSQVASQIQGLSFRNQVQERRFHSLVANMRCLDNPDLSLLESTAPRSDEMRMAVFRMIQDNRADFEIRLTMVDIYGEDVLYQSAFPGHRLLLNYGPIVLLVLGLIAAFVVSMRRRRPAT